MRADMRFEQAFRDPGPDRASRGRPEADDREQAVSRLLAVDIVTVGPELGND